jgi:hypothetical protein
MKKQMLSEKVLNGKQGKQFAYVLQCIEECSRATDEGKEFATDLEKIAFFFECFNSEFNYIQNRKRYPNLTDRIANYLQGLPSCFNIDYWNDEIEKIGKDWGYCQTEKKAEKFVSNWWCMIAYRIIQIANKVGYNLTNIY